MEIIGLSYQLIIAIIANLRSSEFPWRIKQIDYCLKIIATIHQLIARAIIVVICLHVGIELHQSCRESEILLLFLGYSGTP